MMSSGSAVPELATAAVVPKPRCTVSVVPVGGSTVTNIFSLVSSSIITCPPRNGVESATVSDVATLVKDAVHSTRWIGTSFSNQLKIGSSTGSLRSLLSSAVSGALPFGNSARIISRQDCGRSAAL